MSSSQPEKKKLIVYSSWVEQSRLNRVGIAPENLGVGVADGYALDLFAEDSGADTILNIRPQGGSQVWDRVLALSGEEGEVLASQNHGSYSPRLVTVTMQDSGKSDALAYIASADKPEAGIKAPRWSTRRRSSPLLKRRVS